MIDEHYYKSILGGAFIAYDIVNEQEYIYVKSALIIRAITILSIDKELQLNVLLDIFATDHVQQKNKFAIYYHLSSMDTKFDVFVVTEIAKNDVLNSICCVFQNADWYEREIFDMFGIVFADHPNLRKILTINDDGHELLKIQ